MFLHDYGKRKYLTDSELQNFISASASQILETDTFCTMLVLSGCRISEALALTTENIDFLDRLVIIHCLKKRRQGVYRTVPMPDDFLEKLRQLSAERDTVRARLWPWSRMTAFRRVKLVMDLAGVAGLQASPKGLRHAFGVKAIQSGVPLTLLQRWLGHADIRTTAIYTQVMGPEEREIADRMWEQIVPLARQQDVYSASANSLGLARRSQRVAGGQSVRR